jgi:hypothetical protein
MNRGSNPPPKAQPKQVAQSLLESVLWLAQEEAMTSTVVGYCNPFSTVGEDNDTIKTPALDEPGFLDPVEKTVVSSPWWEMEREPRITIRCFPPVSASSLLPTLETSDELPPSMPTRTRHPCRILPVLDPPELDAPPEPSSRRVLATFFSVLALMAASTALLVGFIGT